MSLFFLSTEKQSSDNSMVRIGKEQKGEMINSKENMNNLME